MTDKQAVMDAVQRLPENGYCQAISQDAKRRLYDVLASGEEAEIREVVGQIIETSVPSRKTEPATRSNSP